MDLDRFADVLAERLAAIVPDGIYVAVRDGMLWFSAQEGRFPGQRGDYRPGEAGCHVRENVGADGTPEHEDIVRAAVQALDALQDFVSEATHLPWPGVHRQPRPDGRISGSRLELWYGGPDAVVLACEPVELASFGAQASG